MAAEPLGLNKGNMIMEKPGTSLRWARFSCLLPAICFYGYLLASFRYAVVYQPNLSGNKIFWDKFWIIQIVVVSLVCSVALYLSLRKLIPGHALAVLLLMMVPIISTYVTAAC